MDDVAMPFLLMGAFRALADAVHADLAAAGFPGVRTTHGFAMQAIGTGCSGVQLGERLGVSKQAATKTARALEELGLVTRTASERDRREVRIVPTARGREMLRRSATAFRRELAGWRASHGDAAVDATLRVLAGAQGERDALDLSDWP